MSFAKTIPWEIVLPIAVLAGWLILQIWVLPKFGVST